MLCQLGRVLEATWQRLEKGTGRAFNKAAGLSLGCLLQCVWVLAMLIMPFRYFGRGGVLGTGTRSAGSQLSIHGTCICDRSFGSSFRGSQSFVIVCPKLFTTFRICWRPIHPLFHQAIVLILRKYPGASDHHTTTLTRSCNGALPPLAGVTGLF